ncbi:CheW-like domain protein [compost metagenome]
MNRPVHIAVRPQLALQSYLNALLQEATLDVLHEPVPEPVIEAPARVKAPQLPQAAALDEFQAAVLEEQARDAVVAAMTAAIEQVLPVIAPCRELMPPGPEGMPAERVEPLADVHRPAASHDAPPRITGDGRPAWAAEPFECLLFDVAGLTLAVPLVCLGSIYPLQGHELTPLFGQPDWFLGILPCKGGNLKVLDTARWVMPERYRDDFRQGLQYVISVQGYEWGLAVHQVSRSLRLDPNEIKWRTQRGQRPWLAGTVIEHMCALLDVAELAELIASGAVKQMHNVKPVGRHTR